MTTEERKPYSKCIKISISEPEIKQESGAQIFMTLVHQKKTLLNGKK